MHKLLLGLLLVIGLGNTVRAETWVITDQSDALQTAIDLDSVKTTAPNIKEFSERYSHKIYDKNLKGYTGDYRTSNIYPIQINCKLKIMSWGYGPYYFESGQWKSDYNTKPMNRDWGLLDFTNKSDKNMYNLVCGTKK